MAKFIGSVSVADTQKLLEEKLKRTDALTARRQAANKILRGTNTDIQPRTKPKKKKVIKIDPNVKPIGGTPSPVIAIAQGIRSAFERAGRAGKQAGAKVKEVAQATQKGDKTVVPLGAKPSRNPFKKQTANTVKVKPLKGFEKLAKREGVPQSQTLNQARGVRPGQSGPLPNLIRKRRAAAARKINLGGTRSDRSRGGRERPPLIPGDTTDKVALAKRVKTQAKRKKRSRLAGRVAGGLIGAATGFQAAKKLGGK